MKLTSCPINSNHTVREIERDTRFITSICVTCKRKIYSAQKYSQKPIMNIQRGTVITPEIYDGIPYFQKDVEEDNMDDMCKEYISLIRNSRDETL